MKRTTGLLMVMLFCLMFGSAYAASVPTIHQVYDAAHSGHLREAQVMMGQVLAAHPNSGKAHFVLAEILTAERLYPRAAQELNTARRLEPGLPFEKPQAVSALDTRIQNGLHNQIHSHMKRSSNGHNWVLILLFGLCFILLMVVIRALRRPAGVPATGYSSFTPGNGAPFNNLQGPFTPMTPYGGGFMSNLKTGLGIGAGMAAGEALVNHFIDGNRVGSGQILQDPTNISGNALNDGNDLGGNDFGLNDDSSWNDDSMNAGDDFSGMDGGSDDWN